MTAEFERAMRRLYTEALEQTGYRAGYFIQMVSELGGLGAAKALLAPGRPTHDGFTTLYLHGRLDLTVEATVLANPAFAELFTEDELDTAHQRLALHGYQPPS
ncbi:MAG: hypothetical protein ACJ72N_01055 [Labedaea sp.]